MHMSISYYISKESGFMFNAAKKEMIQYYRKIDLISKTEFRDEKMGKRMLFPFHKA